MNIEDYTSDFGNIEINEISTWTDGLYNSLDFNQPFGIPKRISGNDYFRNTKIYYITGDTNCLCILTSINGNEIFKTINF